MDNSSRRTTKTVGDLGIHMYRVERDFVEKGLNDE